MTLETIIAMGVLGWLAMGLVLIICVPEISLALPRFAGLIR